MRSLLLLVAALPAAVPAQTDLASLSWLAGSWTGTSGRARLEEQWLAPAGGLLVGMSRTVNGEGKAFFEYMRIEQRAEGVFFVAQPGGRPPTSFKLTRAGSSEVVFENPAHDHPKIITYRREGDALAARIEGDVNGRRVAQDFRFQLRK